MKGLGLLDADKSSTILQDAPMLLLPLMEQHLQVPQYIPFIYYLPSNFQGICNSLLETPMVIIFLFKSICLFPVDQLFWN